MRIDVPSDSETVVEYTLGSTRRTLVVAGAEFEELAAQIRDGDVEKAELRRELEATKDRLQRVSDDRATWKEAAHSHAADLARMTDELSRLSDDRDHWEQEAENWKREVEAAGRSKGSVGPVLGVFEAERCKYLHRAGVDPFEVRQSLDKAREAAIKAVHDENERGGAARAVVADVASVLGVDIDEGPGHRWDPDHMRRIVQGAQEACDEVEELQRQVRQLVSEQRLMEAQRDDAVQHAATIDALHPIRMEIPAELFAAPAPDVEELKATIVRQANEITRLKGESE
ncbi:hypothetical protein ACFYZ1_09955 [Streptomyces chartreusis]|uniref:hypothetical protein n=1 Tax=Streptomyces chartreusis TaxID=1969 RepID=UPI003685422F